MNITLQQQSDSLRSASYADWQWLTHVSVVQVQDGEWQDRTAQDAENLCVILSGTHDMFAGSGSWLARGLRKDPRDGKPVGLFLPPKTRYRFADSQGELLLVGSKQPQPEDAETEPAATVKKPLLALAGSGKAFDPSTGTWKRQEDFPSAPEAILPRRVLQEEQEGNTLRHVFPREYKALSLSLLEVVVPKGESFVLPKINAGDYPQERAIYYRGQLGENGENNEGLLCPGPAGTKLTANDEDLYLAVIGAGDKV